MIRPELKSAAGRWREALVGLGALALGLWLALSGFGVTAWLGVALALAGAALALAGWQRGRFRSGGGGPGVVSVDEGRLTYFGPLTGGSVDVRELILLALDPRGRPAHWVLETREETLHVPVTAEGADALFDVFAGLPDLDLSHVLAAMRDPPAAPIVLWRAGGSERAQLGGRAGRPPSLH